MKPNDHPRVPDEKTETLAVWLASPKGIRVLERFLRKADRARERAARLRRVIPSDMKELVD